MARPHKTRRICQKPHCTAFGPLGATKDTTITMSIDEYETIRLIDLEGLTQQQCAQQMDIARTTVQAIYKQAREKLAQSLVGGLRLIISGGVISVCEHKRSCGGQCCTGEYCNPRKPHNKE